MATTTTMDYQADIDIDESALDVEWLDHSARMMRYCRHAAEMQRSMDFAKERVDVVKAEIEQDVRLDPTAYGIAPRVTAKGDVQPPTEGSITATVLVQEKYQEASKAYIDAKYEYAVAQGAVRAFEARKSALENLVRLHGQSYFAGPAVPHDLPALRRERDAAIQKNVRISRRT